MGSDGSLGVKAIREKNGLILVQNPKNAKFDGMPKSASLAVTADVIADAEDLPGKLIEYLKFSHERIKKKEIDVKVISNIEKILILIREQTGNDFSRYKKTTLFRRIERRKGIHQIERIGKYVRFLQENPQEIEILFKELLIGVTSFFRDIKVWEVLKKKVLPEYLKTLPDGYTLRAWVPGCSTGEEAYSLAIVFTEVLKKMKPKKNIKLQIFATDLDKDAIERARKGSFLRNISTDVSENRLEKFFTIEKDQYRINATIRNMLIFAPQNITADPPFTNLDIISCRNMLIYMEPELQKKIIHLFNYVLKINGNLILGTAESIGNIKDCFSDVDAKLKIFKHVKKITFPDLLDFPSRFNYTIAEVAVGKKEGLKSDDSIQSIADQILLQNYSPASVMTNKAGDIVYITGRTGKYLEPVAGKANWNIHAMAKGGLREELPNAFRRAVKSIDPVTIENIRIGDKRSDDRVSIIVQHIKAPPQVKDMVMVIFNDITPEKKMKEKSPLQLNTVSSHRIEELEIQLRRSNEELQSTREEMQTSQEELKSTNEELQSTNEELQSANEELQSTNEELQTVNIELQSKVSDFTRANDDMKNLLNSTEIATLFLDMDLNIRRFTEQLKNIIKVRESDIGRPFTDMVSYLRYPDIGLHSRKVLRTLTPTEKAIETNDKRWFNVRIMPYRTIDDRIDGLVITFTDISIGKRLEIKLKKANLLRTKNKK